MHGGVEVSRFLFAFGHQMFEECLLPLVDWVKSSLSMRFVNIDQHRGRDYLLLNARIKSKEEALHTRLLLEGRPVEGGQLVKGDEIVW